MVVARKSKKVKLLTGVAKAKWLQIKLNEIKHITDNFGHHTPTYVEAIIKFKTQTGVAFESAEKEISDLYKSYWAEKSKKEKEKLRTYMPELDL